MKPSKIFNLVFLLVIVAFSLIIPARAATYLPAVGPGQWAEYKPLYNTCVGDPSVCQATGNSIGDIDHGTVQVVSTYATSVTLKLGTVYKNGTSSQEGAMVDVETGQSNVTSLTGAPTNYFVLAGGLYESDKIWNTDTAPTLNTTLTETVLGVSRGVNFLNYTTSYSSEFGSFFSSSGFAFDQGTGIFVEIAISISATGIGGNFQTAFAMGMVNNNIWVPSGSPDFTISASGPINFQTGSSGSSTITLATQNGFSSTINLAVTAPSGLSCSLSKNSLPGYGTSTLTCTGRPGTYTVNVEATSGSTTHSMPLTVNVSNAAAPSQPSSNLPMLLAYAGIGIVAIIAVLVAYFLLRRKPAPPAIAPSETMPPATPA